MYIVPISSSIQPLNILSQNEMAAAGDDKGIKGPTFADVFREIMGDMEDTQQVLNEDAAQLIMGGIDDLHTIYNHITKAQVAVETFVAVKNACQQSYDQILQISM